MRILVTGAGGFFGSQLARRLVVNNDDLVFGLVHDRRPNIPCDRVMLIGGDVTDYQRMLEVIVDHEIDQIYHCASKAVVRNCNADPVGCFRVNVLGTVNVLEAARQSGRVLSGVLCIESDKSYGHGPIPYKEDQPLRPGGIYEASKAAVSSIIPAYHATYDLPVCGVRMANLYGPGDRHLTRIIPGTITRILRGDRPVIVDGAEKFVREYLHVTSAVDYVVRIMMNVAPWGHSLNVGSGQTATVREVISTICKLMAVADDPIVAARSSTFVEISEQRLDLTQLHKYCKPVEPITLTRGLEETIRWYQKNYKRL